MKQDSTVEFDHCRELALQPGSLFEFTSHYLKPDTFQPLLALYALKEAVTTIPYAHVDDAIKWEKLKWWGEELLADPDGTSRHPVVRALRLSGARQNLENNQLLSLVSSAMMQIDVPPDSDDNAMFERLSALGSAEIQLELALEGAVINTDSLSSLAAASKLAGLVFSFAHNRNPQIEHLPLNMLAKFGVSAAELEQSAHSDAVTQIVSQLTNLNLQWFSDGFSCLSLTSERTTKGPLGLHLQLRWAMERRQLELINRDVSGFLESSRRFGPSDAWFAWRFLRRLN
jgi:phytoene/squalene synthetase